MAKRARSIPENVPGRFYVDETCIYCDLCVAIAPGVFREVNEQGWAAVFHQPTTDEETIWTSEAMDACPTSSIGNDG